MSEQQLDCALDLMRRLPPQRVDRHLSQLIDLQPELCVELLQTVDVPLKISHDKAQKRDYLICDYNRDGDSYRSCWSGRYDPPLEDGAQPSEHLRELEIALNDAFDEYRNQYFEGGVSSVYLWDMDDGFAGVILIKKSSETTSTVSANNSNNSNNINNQSNSSFGGADGNSSLNDSKNESSSTSTLRGCWDSIHVIEVTERPQMKTASYKLTSTVMLWLHRASSKLGILNLGGSLTRVTEKRDVSLLKGQMDHIKNIGQLVENMENRMRNGLSEIYFSKTKDIINSCRSVNTLANDQHKREIAQDIHKRLADKQKTDF